MTAIEIAEMLGSALSTASLWQKRIGLGERSRRDPPEPPDHYGRRYRGEPVHVAIKQPGKISIRGAGHRVLDFDIDRAKVRPGHRRLQTGAAVGSRPRILA